MTARPKPKPRCPWCGKVGVPIAKGRISHHVTPGNNKCVGVGQPAPRK